MCVQARCAHHHLGCAPNQWGRRSEGRCGVFARLGTLSSGVPSARPRFHYCCPAGRPAAATQVKVLCYASTRTEYQFVANGNHKTCSDAEISPQYYERNITRRHTLSFTLFLCAPRASQCEVVLNSGNFATIFPGPGHFRWASCTEIPAPIRGFPVWLRPLWLVDAIHVGRNSARVSTRGVREKFGERLQPSH